MLRRLRKRAGSEGGFTLVEVLVVMLIMGILAGIAVPSFINQRQKADDSSAKANARAAAAAIEAYASDNLGSYESVTATILNGYDSSIPPASQGTVAIGYKDCKTSGNQPICWTVTTANQASGHTFAITKRADGSITSDCTPHGKGGCPSNGGWDN